MPKLTVNIEQQVDKPLVENVSLVQDGALVKIFHATLIMPDVAVLGFAGEDDPPSRTVELYRSEGMRYVYATIAIRGHGWPKGESCITATTDGGHSFIFMWRHRLGDERPLLWSRASDGVSEEEVR